MYTQDYDEMMPWGAVNGSAPTCNEAFNSVTWRGYIANVLAPYVKNGGVWACASDGLNNRNDGVGGCNADPRSFKVSYSYNYAGIGGGGSYTAANNSLAAAVRPADLAILWDSQNRWSDGNNFFSRDVAQYKAGNFAYGARHSEMVNFAFLDGHVKSMRMDQVKLRNVTNLSDGDARLDVPVTTTPLP